MLTNEGLIKTFTLPGNLDVAQLSPVGNTEISSNTSGRVANKGMEGLALTPDGKTLVGIMQASLIQDGNKIVRIVTIDIATGTTHEYAYQLTTGSGVSEILAINDHEFLIDERDGKGLGDNSKAVVKQIYKIDLTGAKDVSNLGGSATDQTALLAAKVSKSLFLDLVNELKALGISDKDIPSKIEGMAFGQDLLYNGVLEHTLYLANDNDFLATITDSNHPNGFANTNNFYVFGIDAATLPTLQAQQFIPEPPTYALMLGSLGLMAIALQRKRNQK